jgi:protein tyrosine/serine phosphatase
VVYEPLHLDWPGLSNARDLGGLPAGDAGRIREGALIRSESLTRLDDGGADVLRAAGVSRVLDLRRPGESPDPHPFADDETTYVNLPVEDPADPKHPADGMLALYLEMLDVRPDLFAAALASIAEAPPGAVVVHCAAGKDRTGLVVGLALSVAGVEPEDVAADYAITEVRFADHFQQYLDSLDTDEERESARAYQSTPPENLRTVLEHLETRYGGVEPYLRRGGMTGEQLEALRERLVEPA